MKMHHLFWSICLCFSTHILFAQNYQKTSSGIKTTVNAVDIEVQYEKGAYTEIPISWNNASRKLTIGARKGAYEGMLKNRKFTVTLQDGTQKNVDYSGKAVSVKF